MYMLGEVTHYCQAKGWGYIREVSKAPGAASALECFFHISIVADKAILQPRDLAVFEISARPFKAGRVEAGSVRLVKRAVADESTSPTKEAL
jgi:hypothetical protein